MSVSDTSALNALAQWMHDNDPILTSNDAGWVWDLTALIDDILTETGRYGEDG